MPGNGYEKVAHCQNFTHVMGTACKLDAKTYYIIIEMQLIIIIGMRRFYIRVYVIRFNRFTESLRENEFKIKTICYIYQMNLMIGNL